MTFPGRILRRLRTVLLDVPVIREGEDVTMKRLALVLLSLLAGLDDARLHAQPPKYPPLSEYLMPPDAEIALAKTAAPANISDRATIKVLTSSGFQVVHQIG